MRPLSAVLLLLSMLAAGSVWAQDKPAAKAVDTSLESENLVAEAKDLDSAIIDLSRKIGDAVKKYKLYGAKDVTVLPFQITFESKDGYVMLTRHYVEKQGPGGKISGLREKRLKIYTDGNAVSRLESIIIEKEYAKFSTNIITVNDPSPSADGTDDIVFQHTYNDRPIVSSKPFREIKNTTAFPLANNIKRDFYIPHLQYFYTNLVAIGETYLKGSKDNETIMQDILRKSTDY